MVDAPHKSIAITLCRTHAVAAEQDDKLITTTPLPPMCGMSMTSRTTDEVSRNIQRVLWHNRPSSLHGERRGERRHPFPYPVHLLPVTADGQSPIGEAIIVHGKDLSEQGLGFYHTKPLAERHVLATFDCGAFRAKFLMELTWCRFGSHGLFENGGRFLQALE